MKLTSFALLLCASSALANLIITECTGPFKNSCPWGYTQEWHGRNALNAYCSCVRPETEEEAYERLKERAAEECELGKNFCTSETLSLYAYDQIQENTCTRVFKFCERGDIIKICNGFKEEGSEWQCDAESSKISQEVEEQEVPPHEKEKAKACQEALNRCASSKGNTSRFSSPCTAAFSICAPQDFKRFCEENEDIRGPPCLSQVNGDNEEDDDEEEEDDYNHI